MPSKRKKVTLLFLVNDPSYFVTHRLCLAKATLGLGYDVHVAVPFTESNITNRKDLALIQQTGAKLHDWKMHRADTAIFGELRTLRRAWQVIKRVNPDIMHSVTIKPVLYGGGIARFRRQRVVFAISGLGHTFIAQGIKAKINRLLIFHAYRIALFNKFSRTIFQN
ncbi:MAG TPA: glycosyltransferase family 1 protein, partial [Alphaproteobacteria bacterium]|nr:glycosyltransferase family 1 protein [Alphaproteobacteria bacterium]